MSEEIKKQAKWAAGWLVLILFFILSPSFMDVVLASIIVGIVGYIYLTAWFWWGWD